MARLHLETAKANADAESARAEIAKANARAADASQKAAEAQLALEKFKQPRKIAEDRISLIADKLRQFSGTRFDAAAIPGDPEAIIFLTFVTAMLESAGWKWVDWSPPNGPLAQVWTITGTDKPNIGQFGFFDVLILFHPDHAAELSKPAEALVTALKAEGFAAAFEVASNPSIPNKDNLHITVGRKR